MAAILSASVIVGLTLAGLAVLAVGLLRMSYPTAWVGIWLLTVAAGGTVVVGWPT